MREEFDAIYEDGVLRPLTPVELREHEVVSVSISNPRPAVSARAARQRDVLLAFMKKMETLVEDSPSDEVTNRDHDRILYGEQ